MDVIRMLGDVYSHIHMLLVSFRPADLECNLSLHASRAAGEYTKHRNGNNGREREGAKRPLDR